MYKNAVKYRDVWLAPASKGMELYHDKKFKELDSLLKELDRKDREQLGCTSKSNGKPETATN